MDEHAEELSFPTIYGGHFRIYRDGVIVTSFMQATSKLQKFVIKLIMEIYNRFTDNDGYCNAYITCASTGKAAVAIDGTTVHTTQKISLQNFYLCHQKRCNCIDLSSDLSEY